MKEIKLKPIPEEISRYFAEFGKNWWKNLSEEDKEKHRKKLREGVRKSLRRRKKKTSLQINSGGV